MSRVTSEPGHHFGRPSPCLAPVRWSTPRCDPDARLSGLEVTVALAEDLSPCRNSLPRQTLLATVDQESKLLRVEGSALTLVESNATLAFTPLVFRFLSRSLGYEQISTQ
jgi:hypothetical protein